MLNIQYGCSAGTFLPIWKYYDYLNIPIKGKYILENKKKLNLFKIIKLMYNL